MSIVAETSRSSQHARLRRPRKQPTSAPDPTLQTHLIVHPTRKKSTISGLLGSPFSDTNDNAASLLSKKTNKKKTFTSVALSGLGCVKCLSPVVVGSSGEWGANKVRKKKKKKQRTRVENATAKTTTLNGAMSPRVVVVVPDLCCTPGIGLAASNAALVDFVEPTRSLPSRGRVNAHRTNNREVFFFFFFFLMDKKKCVCVCVCVWQKKSTPENGGHIQWAQRDKTIQEKQKTTFSSTNSIKDIEPSFM